MAVGAGGGAAAGVAPVVADADGTATMTPAATRVPRVTGAVGTAAGLGGNCAALASGADVGRGAGAVDEAAGLDAAGGFDATGEASVAAGNGDSVGAAAGATTAAGAAAVSADRPTDRTIMPSVPTAIAAKATTVHGDDATVRQGGAPSWTARRSTPMAAGSSKAVADSGGSGGDGGWMATSVRVRSAGPTYAASWERPAAGRAAGARGTGAEGRGPEAGLGAGAGAASVGAGVARDSVRRDRAPSASRPRIAVNRASRSVSAVSGTSDVIWGCGRSATGSHKPRGYVRRMQQESAREVAPAAY